MEDSSTDGSLRKRTSNSVLIIYTGGTIGMVKDPDNLNALKPDLSYVKQELDTIQNDSNTDFPLVEFVQFDEIIDSSDITITDWCQIAKYIDEGYYEYDGFVVIMGTDTMAYTSSALSFMLKNLAKPVVFTGAMIPLFEGHSDARRNLLISIQIAATSNIPEVCIFFHDKLLRANRSKKLKNTHLDAFVSPNYPPLATYGTHLEINESVLLKHPRKKFNCIVDMNSKVLVIRLIPGFADDSIGYLLKSPDVKETLRCLVLELYGNGNFPMRKKAFVDILRRAISMGILLVICSQCIYGEVDLTAYRVGKLLGDIGAISAHDMTVEAVATKLAYLFGQGHTNEKVKNLFKKDIRGELTAKQEE